MATLAIKGHKTRGSEVIALLEMLGGDNSYNHRCGAFITRIYFINEDGNIESCDSMHHLDYTQFTLEEFEEKFPLKIGNKVIDSKTNSIVTIYQMYWSENNNCVYYDVKKLNNTGFRRSYKFLQPHKEQETMKKEILPHFLTVYDSEENKHEIVATDGYEIKEENGKFYAVKKEPQYPKTYKECCKVLGLGIMENYGSWYKRELIIHLQELLIARDAYWKIAGEEMGLGKPWEPDFDKENEYKYGLFRLRNIIYKDATCINPTLLIFPTKEMRDAFYENFKELIEECKELL